MPEVIVLDSHIWFWWVNLEHDRLPPDILPLLEEALSIGVSAVSCFELALAHRRGRLEFPLAPADWFARALGGSDVALLPLTATIAMRAVTLSDVHRDPFDRIIIATAVELDARLASVDGNFPAYPELKGRLLGKQRA